MPREHLDWVLGELRAEPRQTHYRLAQSYYLGDHRLAFSTEKFKTEFGTLLKSLSDNLCPAVIDSLNDRLQVRGFTGADEDSPLSEAAWAVWRRNMMELRSSEVHRHSLLAGDGYVIVWPDVAGEAAIWPQDATTMCVAYDEDRPGRLSMAGKAWQDGQQHLRVTLYYADSIEKYRSTKPLKTVSLPRLSAKHFDPHVEHTSLNQDDLAADGAIPNPYGAVPVFHFPNKRLHEYGLSELLDVIPLQDVLNKSLSDMLVAGEFSAFRQRWVTGMPLDEDPQTGEVKPPPFKAGADRMFAVSDPAARFGDFNTTDLGQFLSVQDSIRAEIARVSGVPLHYLFLTKGDFPSGEAMKAAEARFTRKIGDRQLAYGAVWEDVVEFALRVDGRAVPDDARIQLDWEAAAPTSDRERLELLVMKRALGVPDDQLLVEAGYERKQVAEWRVDKDEQAAALNGNGTEDLGGSIVMPTATGRLRVPDTRPE